MSEKMENSDCSLYDCFVYLLKKLIADSQPDIELKSEWTPYFCAVRHALHELGEISVNANFNEEDRTSSLIGHLSSHFGWYGLISRLSQGAFEEPQEYLCWAYQRKKEEAIKGGDFGLAFPVSDNEFKISFFQAKIEDSNTSGTTSIWRQPSAYVDEKKKEADDRLFRLLDGTPKFSENGKQDHQVVKLANIKHISGSLGLKNNDWIHYIFWPLHKTIVPYCLSLTSILNSIKLRISKGESNVHKLLRIPTQSLPSKKSFAWLLTDGLKDNYKGWVTVDLNTAVKLIGKLTPLCSDWIIIDESGSGGGRALVHQLSQNEHIFEPKALSASIQDLPLVDSRIIARPEPPQNNPSPEPSP